MSEYQKHIDYLDRLIKEAYASGKGHVEIPENNGFVTVKDGKIVPLEDSVVPEDKHVAFPETGFHVEYTYEGDNQHVEIHKYTYVITRGGTEIARGVGLGVLKSAALKAAKAAAQKAVDTFLDSETTPDTFSEEIEPRSSSARSR
jgi:hypothetical protein